MEIIENMKNKGTSQNLGPYQRAAQWEGPIFRARARVRARARIRVSDCKSGTGTGTHTGTNYP